MTSCRWLTSLRSVPPPDKGHWHLKAVKSLPGLHPVPFRISSFPISAICINRVCQEGSGVQPIRNLILALSSHGTSHKRPGISQLGSHFSDRMMALMQKGCWESQMRSGGCVDMEAPGC